MRLVPVLLAAIALSIPAQAASDRVFTAEFSNPGLTPSHWAMTIHPDGSGHFRSDGAGPRDPHEGIEASAVDRDVEFTRDFAQRVFETAQRHKFFGGACESHLKVAFVGLKRLSYQGPDGQGSCEFNYSKDSEIQALGESLVSVALTIVEGAKLESLLHHDPLGLDKEMEVLTDAAADGRAQQVGAIRGILQHLADDDNVLDRVRKRARALLAKNR